MVGCFCFCAENRGGFGSGSTKILIEVIVPFRPGGVVRRGREPVSYTHLDVYKRQPLVILDIGAPESNVLREALETDDELTGENLKYITDELDLELIFNVIVSGADDNVNENLNYYGALAKSLESYFKVNMLINDVTFKADKESEALRERLIEKGSGDENNIIVVGKTGQRLSLIHI